MRFIKILTFLLITNLTIQVKIDFDALTKPRKLALVNVHMEQPNQDTLEVKKLESERRIERDRIRDLEEMQEIDKRHFQQILESQNNLLIKLSEAAEKSTQLVQEIIKDPSAKLTYDNFKIPANILAIQTTPQVETIEKKKTIPEYIRSPLKNLTPFKPNFKETILPNGPIN